MGCFCPSYSKYFEALPFLIVFVLGGQGDVGGTLSGALFMAEGSLELCMAGLVQLKLPPAPTRNGGTRVLGKWASALTVGWCLRAVIFFFGF